MGEGEFGVMEEGEEKSGAGLEFGKSCKCKEVVIDEFADYNN
jgi:hypothetical protein